jgi:uncharacterized protein (TIGR02145 family)
MKLGRSGIGLLLAGTILATSASIAGAWMYSTEEVEYEGSPFIIGTHTGQTYVYRVGVATNESADPDTLDVELNYHNGFIGQYWYSIDGGVNWIEVPKAQATLSVANVASGDSVQLRAVVIVGYRYLSTSPWGEADESLGDEYYYAFPPDGRYYAPGTSDVDKAGFVAVTSVSSTDAWTYSTEDVVYQGSSLVVGTQTGQDYMYRVGVVTNDSGVQETLNVELNYHNGFFGQYLYSIDDGVNWIDIPKNQAVLSVENVASGNSVQLKAVTLYYRYLSTSPWGEADTSIGDEYYFAFPPGGRYYAPGTSDVDKAGFVAVTSYTGPADDLDGDGQTVSQGDCNDLDDTIYTGAPEVCGDGIDQDCDGTDESCAIPTVTSAGLTWMDRNLGAFRAAADMTDEDAFGDYYQWGRETDGHEQEDSTTTDVLSTSDNPGHNSFITTDSTPHDWRTSQNDDLWQGESGINNPCPSGFRLPTATEFMVERATWSSSNPDAYIHELAYASPLKLIGAGSRTFNGTLYPGNFWGCYWTSTVDDNKALYFQFSGDSASIDPQYRSYGKSVRCIQDYSDDDLDEDGQTVNEGDCNDLDDAIYTGAPEICDDGVDQDCDGADGPCVDEDGDGQSVGEGDCDDLDDTIYTGAPEVCGDGIDQDCNGDDESCTIPTVTSAEGLVWMDRNLGASRVATSSTDSEAYGDLYQWGRLDDGHESRTSDTIFIQSDRDIPGHDDFIILSGYSHDWRSPKNNNLWQGESGINNPCPTGFRLPTMTEINTERYSWSPQNSAGAYASPAKFVMAGYRDKTNGTVYHEGSHGYYWSSTVSGGQYDYHSDFLSVSGQINWYHGGRAYGRSVRCIQDYADNDIDMDGQTINEGDCNDLDATIYAGAPETCDDGIDQDCDGTDEPCVDIDGDGQSPNQGDCNDYDDTIYTGAPETCDDGIDQDCDGNDEACVDVDEDGQTVSEGDCNDLDATIYAGAPETCDDGIDQDCDGNDEPCVDEDGDGQSPDQGDCNDYDDTIYTGAPESCEDGIDQNCDGVDESCIQMVQSAGQIWMDRNLGATRVAIYNVDNEAYGDLYQWGRLKDGHESRISATTSTLSDSDIPGHGYFIATSESPHDWRNPQNNNMWQGVSGINNPCPSGFRLPTETELNIEKASWDPDDFAAAFESPLRLSLAGRRENDGSNYFQDIYGYYWSSTVSGSQSRRLFIDTANTNMMGSTSRGYGLSARCILDNGSEADIDEDGQSISEGDCNDLDDTIYTGAIEVCGDGIDQDCDGADVVCVDIDEDGQSVSEGDCNDLDDTIYLGALETCEDGIDQNCDGWDEPCGLPAGTVFSAGQIWMDRNLGAPHLPGNYNDHTAFGDYYQWGRGSDGHENLNSATTATLSSSDDPGHGYFILTDSEPHDWRNPQNDDLWQGESGINNPCSSGFRLPTAIELNTEKASWTSELENYEAAFASPLKLTGGGFRSRNDGLRYISFNSGTYWSSTVNSTEVLNLFFNHFDNEISSGDRANGRSIRCIQD